MTDPQPHHDAPEPVEDTGSGADVESDADAAEPAENPATEDDLAVEDPLAAAERARDEYLDALQRERAAFANFRKRAAKERMDALDRGAESLCASLLAVLDNLALAIAAAEGDEGLTKGVQMVSDQLHGVLAQAGLEAVPGVGAGFDPTIHEALARQDAAEASDEPVVVEVYRTGYRFKGRTLRPASVKVAQ